MALKELGYQDSFFNGGLDGDSDVKSIAPGDYVYALNFRNKYTQGSVDGSIEGIEGNRKVDYDLPAGTNKCIGKLEDVAGRTIFYFIWNSNGDHKILRWYSQDAVNPIQEILGTDVLNFGEWDYITHCNLVGDLLYWTDGVNPQRYINVSRANRTDKLLEFIVCFSPQTATSVVRYNFNDTITGLTTDVTYPIVSVSTRVQAAAVAYVWFTGLPYIASRFTVVNEGEYLRFTAINPMANLNIGITTLSGDMASWFKPKNYYVTISERDLDVVGWPAWTEPDVELQSAPNVTTNYLQGACFQFAYSINYDDGQASVLSKYSRFIYNNVANTLLKDYTNYQQDTVQTLTDVNSVLMRYFDKGRLEDSRQIIKSIDVYVRNSSTENAVFKLIDTLNEWELDGRYYFFNTQQGNPIAPSTQNKGYDNIPIVSYGQEVVNNKLFYTNNLVGYDNVPFTGRIVPGQASRLDGIIQVPLSLGRYRVGVVYFDRLGRNCFVQTNPSLTTTIYDPPTSSGFANRVQWIIPKEFQPPIWATHYAWVRTRELSSQAYFPVTGTTITYRDAAGASQAWGNPNIKTAEFTCSFLFPALNYGKFAQGDQLLLYVPGGVSYSVAIVSYDETTKLLVVEYNVANNPNLLQINTVAKILRIYIPRKQNETELFYEFDECYEIINPGEAGRVHGGGAFGTNQVLNTTDATGYFMYGWDTFEHLISPTVNGVTKAEAPYPITSRSSVEKVVITKPVSNGGIGRAAASNNATTTGRSQQINANTGGSQSRRRQAVGDNAPPSGEEVFIQPPTIQVEEEVLINTFPIDGTGRANAIVQDNKQVRLAQGVTFSSVYNVGTGYNGFGTFNELSSINLPIGFGAIKRIFNIDNILVVVMENKCFSVYIDKGILQGQDGSVTISVSGQVVGAYRELAGIHGTMNPESFASMDGLLFWWDAYRGEVCQYGSDGITAISAYKMNTPFAIKGKQQIQAFGPEFKVKGAVIKQFSEYVLCFPEYTIDDIGYPRQTFVFNFDDNRWKGEYSFLPEMITSFGVMAVSFLNGELWVHDSAVRGNFYGTQYPCQLRWPINTAEKTDKNFVSIAIESNQAPNLPTITTPISELNLAGQLSELLSTDFEFMNNSYFASFMNNKLTPNFINQAEALANGENLTGQTLLLFYSKESTGQLVLRSARVYYNLNELTN